MATNETPGVSLQGRFLRYGLIAFGPATWFSGGFGSAAGGR
jgi:hypothetical protein